MAKSDDVRALLERLRTHLDEPEIMTLLAAEQMFGRFEKAKGDFSVTNLVSHRTGEGKLDICWLDAVVQVDVVKAREIAWILLESAAVAESEAMFIRFLRERVHLDPVSASTMLHEFRTYRETSNDSLVSDKPTH